MSFCGETAKHLSNYIVTLGTLVEDEEYDGMKQMDFSTISTDRVRVKLPKKMTDDSYL